MKKFFRKDVFCFKFVFDVCVCAISLYFTTPGVPILLY